MVVTVLTDQKNQLYHNNMVTLMVCHIQVV